MAVIFRALRGVEETGPNAYFLDIDGFRLLLDCGATSQSDSYDWPSVDAVWITHAHFDHAGGLPKLIEKCSPKIYASVETSNDLRRHLGIPRERANAISDIVEHRKFHETFDFCESVQATPVETGHLPGAGGLIIETDGVRIGYTGDLGFAPAEFANGFSNLDLLICEHALSNHRHLEAVAVTPEQLGEPDIVIARALGEADRILEAHPSWRTSDALALDTEIDSEHLSGRPFIVPPDFENDQVRRLVFDVVANPKGEIIFVNAAGSSGLGRTLLETPRRGRFRYGGRWFRLRARVRREVMPLHPSRDQLLSFIRRVGPRHVAFVHGPPDAVFPMRRALKGSVDSVLILSKGEALQVDTLG